MRNATSITHIPVAKAIIILFLSQMAILITSISFARLPQKKIYMRSTINSEEAARAR
jgi:hypothetical protein